MKKTILSQDLRWAKLNKNPTCRQCGKTKTPNDFPRNAVDYSCNSCRRDYARNAYRKKIAALTPEQLAKYREKVSERQKRQRKARMAAMSDDQLTAWKRQINDGNSERRYAVRDQVYRAYGGYVCACCGEKERKFLSIDHINNDGAKHRREFNLKTGEQMYRWLARNNFPAGFQILCMNCQWGKRNNNGICPHQVRCNDHPERE